MITNTIVNVIVIIVIPDRDGVGHDCIHHNHCHHDHYLNIITNTIVIVIVIIVIADGDRAGRDWVRGEPWVVGVPALDTSFHSSW